jgi:hypothetical protein
MYSLYDQYQDLIRGHRSEFTYNGETFYVSFEVHGFGVVLTHSPGKNRIQARSRKGEVQCMMDLQGMAACLLAEKKDLYFKNHEFCTKEQYTVIKTELESISDDCERLMNSVLDIDTDDRDPLI